MTGEEFKAARIRAGLSYRLAAEALGVSLSTVQRYEQSEEVPVAASGHIRSVLERRQEPDAVASALGHLFALLEVAHGRPLPQSAWITVQAKPALAVNQAISLVRSKRPAQYRELEDAITATMAAIPAFPAQLTEEGMATFWLGFYHEKGDLKQRAY